MPYISGGEIGVKPAALVVKVDEKDLTRFLALYAGCNVRVETTPAVGEWLVIVE